MMGNRAPTGQWALICLLPCLLLGCIGADPSLASNIQLTLSRDGEQVDVDDDPLSSTVSMASTTGTTEAEFQHDDPFVRVNVRVDGGHVSAGDDVAIGFDSTRDFMQVEVEWGEQGLFVSSAAGSSGDVHFNHVDTTQGSEILDVAFGDIQVGAVVGGSPLQLNGSMRVARGGDA